jgi:cell division initiation protein
MTGVDDFLEIVSNDYNALFKENAILKGKLKVLVEKVEEYRSTEDAMRMALLTAQRMGEEITVEANRTKDEMIKSADVEIKAKLRETAARVAEEEIRLAAATKETAKFIKLTQAILTKHSDFLSKIETVQLSVKPKLEPEIAPVPVAKEAPQAKAPEKAPQPVAPVAPVPPIAPVPPVAVSQDIEIDIAAQIGNAVEQMASENIGTTPVQAAHITTLDEDVIIHAPQPAHPAEATTTAHIPTIPVIDVAPIAHIPTEPPVSLFEEEDVKIHGIEETTPDITPRPKFDFDDLKFGANFDSDD